MSIFFQSFLPILTLTLLGIFLFASVLRRPFNSTKVSFLLFALFFISWNVFELFFGNKADWELFRIALSHLTLFFLNIAALNFPLYNRRENIVSYTVVFIGGIGYVTLIFLFFSPFVEKNYPIEFIFFEKIQFYLSRSFDLMSMINVLAVSYMKLVNAVPRLRRALYMGLLIIFIGTIGVGISNFELEANRDFLATNNLLLYLDFIFLLMLVVAILQFQVISFYPGFLSFFVHGEIPELIVQKSSPASEQGASLLKEELWRLYEGERWDKFLSEFWFSLIVDETLGNALLHGGKRYDDELIVQVFESKKYLDFYVIDMGKGFDPQTLFNREPDEDAPSGKGIFILKKLYQVDWNFLGNEVRVRVSKNPADNPREDAKL